MLLQLSIFNYAIIKETQISFSEGLNIITGETGAGKSILIGALGLLLGNRADTKVLFRGDDKCIVEGKFLIKQYNLKSFFNHHELDYEDETIIRREITQSGKSRAFINDTPVNLSLLKELGSNLVDIVSQHQTLELNEAAFQLNTIDAVAENNSLLSNYQASFLIWQKLKKQLNELVEKEQKARQDEDYIKFILKEFEDAALKINEQTELENNLNILSNAEQIQQCALFCANALNESENAIIDILAQIKTNLLSNAKHHNKFDEIANRIASNIIDLKDIASELSSLANTVQANPQELEKTEQRLQLIYNLQKKHRVNSINELLQIEAEFYDALLKIGSLSEEIIKTEAAIENEFKTICELSSKLSQSRENAIELIENKIKTLLDKVSLSNAIFKVKNTKMPFEEATYTGIDSIEFLFSANKGMPPLPVNKAASGGELSRLMLCIKSLITNKMKLPTVIFDEIDTGISGDTAQKVAAVLQQHASQHQVIAITHLPQIAAKSQNHYHVFKNNNTNTSITEIKKLNHIEKINEIARMLSGNNPSETVLKAAKELIENN